MEFYIYVELKPYVRQWLLNKFGAGEWKVKFPTQSRENAFLRTRLLVRPEGCSPKRREGDEVGIEIPTTIAKPPERYNYITAEDRFALIKMIEHLFEKNFKDEILFSVEMGVTQRSAIKAWMKRNGVHIDHLESLQMVINRMMMAYRKKGVEISPSKQLFKKYEKIYNKRP